MWYGKRSRCGTSLAPFQNNVIVAVTPSDTLLFSSSLPPSHRFYRFLCAVCSLLYEGNSDCCRPTNTVNNGTKQKVIRMPPTTHMWRKQKIHLMSDFHFVTIVFSIIIVLWLSLRYESHIKCTLNYHFSFIDRLLKSSAFQLPANTAAAVATTKRLYVYCIISAVSISTPFRA